MSEAMGEIRRRIGVMGGTFDPPHYGHLAAAQAALTAFKLEKVLFVPASYPPHKNVEQTRTAHHRYAMTQLAVAGNPQFEVSRVEIDRSGPSYTIDTIRLLQKEYADAILFFICGADMALDLPTWYDVDSLLGACQFVAVARPGYDLTQLANKLGPLYHKHSANLHVLNVPGVDIAATDIRLRLQQGESVRYLVPDAVLEYAVNQGIYREPLAENQVLPAAEDLSEWVQKRLSSERYEHTCRVVAEALRLATIHGLDAQTVQTAAWLHDCTRELPVAVQLKLVNAFGIVLADIMHQSQGLLHAETAAIVAQSEWNITQIDVLNAIRFHTTGRSGMSDLEKVVFLADYIEPGRCFPQVVEVRQLADRNLNAAMLQALNQTINYVIEQGLPLHPATIDARNHLLKRNDS